MAMYLGPAILAEYVKTLTPLRAGDYLVKKIKTHKKDTDGSCMMIVQVQKIRAKTMLVQHSGYAIGYGLSQYAGYPLLAMPTFQVTPFKDSVTSTVWKNKNNILPLICPLGDEFQTKDAVYYRIDHELVLDLFQDTYRIGWDGTHYHRVTFADPNTTSFRILSSQKLF
jgi:hypothetical protein